MSTFAIVTVAENNTHFSKSTEAKTVVLFWREKSTDRAHILSHGSLQKFAKRVDLLLIQTVIVRRVMRTSAQHKVEDLRKDYPDYTERTTNRNSQNHLSQHPHQHHYHRRSLRRSSKTSILYYHCINPGIALWGIGQTGAFFESETEQLGLLETFLFGSLIAAVDPVAVLAVFDEIKVSFVFLPFCLSLSLFFQS